MGMAGAAYATIIGQIASTVVVIIYMKNFKTVPLLAKHFKLNINYIKTYTNFIYKNINLRCKNEKK